MTIAPPSVRYTAADIATALEQPAPTPEQAAVIETTASSCLVVAGAGSGKTETMAGRVVWLVANGIVRPDQVLGLTFTRKAASELASRVRRRLAQLAARGLVDAELISAADPAISTYDAYAGRIVAENALRLGHEPGQRLIPQTVAWQYARRVVDTYDGPMEHITVTPSTVTNDVRALAEGLAQHRVSSEQVRAFCEQMHAVLTALPKAATQGGAKPLHVDIAGVAAALAARCELLPIVAAYRDAKRRRECLDFADQMSLAADLAEQFAEVAAGERNTFRAVLLDEYQDTSHAQLVFLRALFGGLHEAIGGVHAAVGAAPLLTAVGDPSQAIYGWRGASQGTLAAFPQQFPDADRPASVLTLGTSFRNSGRVLEVANAIAEPLRDGVVSTPTLRARDDAPIGVVRCGLYPTIDDEADAIGDHVATVWQADAQLRAAGQPSRSVAVLVRAWRQLPRIEAALRARGVPIEIVGVGGLLLEPDVVDVVATLRVMVDPMRGDALMRLLTGARWRIGARDLATLRQWARELMRSTPRSDDVAAPPHVAVVADAAAATHVDEVDPDPDEVDEASIIDALDDLPPRGWLTAEGHQRLARLSGELRSLRARLAQPLPDVVADVVRTIGIDVEVLARGGDVMPMRANLDRLVEVAAEFAAGGDEVSVGAFLDYLDAAAVEERGLDRGEEPESSAPEIHEGIGVRRDRVQLLTVHAAKGLEWDVVCVPGLVDKLFPGVRPADVKGWLTQRGALPWPLRGDRDGLPTAVLEGHVDQAEAVQAIERFKEAATAHLQREERRLAYVAVTRARSMLLCTGYRWDLTKTPRDASVFLDDVHAVCAGGGDVDCWTAIPPDGTANPLLAVGPTTAPWPFDPLGDRRAAVESAAELVTSMTGFEPDTSTIGVAYDDDVALAMNEWGREVEVLLAERLARNLPSRLDVELPRQLSVSQLVTLRRDPDELARQLRRPLPAAPAPLARRGTAFHLWLEQRFSSPRLLDLDEVPGAADADAAPDADLEMLQQAFLATTWADRDPVEVEVPFELVIDDIVIRGRMDAVFRDPDGGFTVVDWKTGRRPTGADVTAAAIQLAAYRLAWADLNDVELSAVRAVFCYLRAGADGETVAPADLLDRAGLVALLRAVPID